MGGFSLERQIESRCRQKHNPWRFMLNVPRYDSLTFDEVYIAVLIRSLLVGKSVNDACMDATEAGANNTTVFGAITGV
jgi:hypothetical protein